MTELVTLQEHDTHVVIVMDDGKANALSFDMFSAVNAALDVAEKAGKVVVLAGRPGKFSAGFDLKVMSGGGQPMVDLLRSGAELAQRLLKFPTPVILAVSGHALAMGALLCLSADYRIGMHGNYKIGVNEVAIGMTMPWFGVELTRARLDLARVNAAVGLAQIYSADEAVSVGYLDEAVEAEHLLARANEMAATLAQLDMAAHKATKLRVREIFIERLEAALQRDFSDGDAVAILQK